MWSGHRVSVVADYCSDRIAVVVTDVECACGGERKIRAQIVLWQVELVYI